MAMLVWAELIRSPFDTVTNPGSRAINTDSEWKILGLFKVVKSKGHLTWYYGVGGNFLTLCQ